MLVLGRGPHIRNKPALFHPFPPLTGANKTSQKNLPENLVKLDWTVKILFSEDTVDGKHLKILYFKFRFKEMRKKHFVDLNDPITGLLGVQPYWVFQPRSHTKLRVFPLRR